MLNLRPCGGTICGKNAMQREVDKMRALFEWRQDKASRSGPGPPRPGVPLRQRWEIVFPEGQTQADYIEFLDKFKIELAVLTDPQTLTYASRFGNATPHVRDGALADEFRMHFVPTPGRWRAADTQLLDRLRIVADQSLMWMIDDWMEQQLLALEVAYSQENGVSLQQIKTTRFSFRCGVDPDFFVVDQTSFTNSGY
ncbi:MAG TPA: hypothetical protein VGX78_20295 [Pirellulales bacterium]|jgi:hypothetical protein|nr:hypothetical protein [Pirellulales bacterium]